MADYTPGPWTCHSGSVWKDGPNVYPKGAGEDGIPICHMDREPGNGTLPVERDANAYLVAKAPEMAEQRNKLLEIVEQLAKRDCEYPGSVGCSLLPEGVRRSVCMPCKAKAAVAEPKGD